MPRPPRRRLKFDEDSVNKLLQEIYDDTHNIKARINRLFTKWEQKVKEGGEIAAIGDQIVKLLLAEAKTQDQKIMLLRYLKEVVFDNNTANTFSNTKKPEKEDEITTNRKNELLDMVARKLEENDKNKRE